MAKNKLKKQQIANFQKHKSKSMTSNKFDKDLNSQTAIKKRKLTKIGLNEIEQEKQVSNFEKLTKVIVWLMLISIVGASVVSVIMIVKDYI